MTDACTVQTRNVAEVYRLDTKNSSDEIHLSIDFDIDDRRNCRTTIIMVSNNYVFVGVATRYLSIFW